MHIACASLFEINTKQIDSAARDAYQVIRTLFVCVCETAYFNVIALSKKILILYNNTQSILIKYKREYNKD